VFTTSPSTTSAVPTPRQYRRREADRAIFKLTPTLVTVIAQLVVICGAAYLIIQKQINTYDAVASLTTTVQKLLDTTNTLQTRVNALEQDLSTVKTHEREVWQSDLRHDRRIEGLEDWARQSGRGIYVPPRYNQNTVSDP
jgi:hypothetical protein